uniref:Radial spoke head protein 3 homolog n=1 Tax=Clastoptera arizonana TaxID=38151 RepID=A0A1B6DKY5_9HEMI
MERSRSSVSAVLQSPIAHSSPLSALKRSGDHRESYSFQSSPRPLYTTRKNYRHPPENVPSNLFPGYGNIMSDRRVVRGSTFSHPVATVGTDSQAARQAEARRRNLARRKAQGQQTKALRLRLGTPPPVDGRSHEQVQTELYLEELFDQPPNVAISCQTDHFLDRPETPPFVPAKIGVDVETQIYPGELFHFDTEVQPILEVLVGKTIEQALVEVLEEEELAAMREQQRRYKEIRLAEKAEEQRLEEQERRKREEAEKRIKENEEALRIQKETEERVAAAVLTSGYIAELLPSVLDGLKESGFLLDDIRQDVEENFMTWLMGEVTLEMQRMVENKDLLTEIVREILETRAEIYRAMGEGSVKPSDEEPSASPLPAVEETEVKEEDAEPEVITKDHSIAESEEKKPSSSSVKPEDNEDTIDS